MTKAKTKDYSEIRDIRDDLDSVLSNVVALTKHLQEDGLEKAAELTEELKKTTMKAAGRLAAKGEHKMTDIEKAVKSHPGKSLLFAFAGGVLASILLNRKS